MTLPARSACSSSEKAGRSDAAHPKNRQASPEADPSTISWTLARGGVLAVGLAGFVSGVRGPAPLVRLEAAATRTPKKAQVTKNLRYLGLRRGAGDGNRTRTISLGS
jgi:hypothetical protein